VIELTECCIQHFIISSATCGVSYHLQLWSFISSPVV